MINRSEIHFGLESTVIVKRQKITTLFSNEKNTLKVLLPLSSLTSFAMIVFELLLSQHCIARKFSTQHV